MLFNFYILSIIKWNHSMSGTQNPPILDFLLVFLILLDSNDFCVCPGSSESTHGTLL